MKQLAVIYFYVHINMLQYEVDIMFFQKMKMNMKFDIKIDSDFNGNNSARRL